MQGVVFRVRLADLVAVGQAVEGVVEALRIRLLPARPAAVAHVACPRERPPHPYTHGRAPTCTWTRGERGDMSGAYGGTRVLHAASLPRRGGA